MNIKITLADRIFSNRIRMRDGWKCVRCKRQHEPYQGTLDCSHFFTRVARTTRFYPDNCDALCKIPCHFGHPKAWQSATSMADALKGTGDGEYTVFKRKQLGKERFEKLCDLFHNKSLKDFYPNKKEQEKDARRINREEIKSMQASQPIIFGAR